MGVPYAVSSDLVSAYPAKSLAIATYLDDALAAKTDTAMVQNAQTGTSYSYALADASKLLSMSNAASNTVLVTKQATVTWVTGTQLRVINLGAGVTTLVADTGVTINGNVALKQYQGGTLIRTASDVWLFVPTASSSGMDLMTPTSVAGTGVTLSGGQVSFSAATIVSVNGCFTGTYDNYLVALAIKSGSASLALRYRAAGSDASSGNYDSGGNYAGTSSGNINNAGATSHQLYVSSAVMNDARFLIYSPFLTEATRHFAEVNQSDNAGVNYAIKTSGNFRLTTSFDGFSFFPGGAGNYTGTCRIYGLRNS